MLADFPPVIGGTTIWYYRICELLDARGYSVFTLGGKGTPPGCVTILDPARTGNTLMRWWLFLLDAGRAIILQRAAIAELLNHKALRFTDTAKLLSYLVLIRRAAKSIPAEEGIVLASHANMNSVLGFLLCRRHGRLKLVIRSHGACVLELAQKNPGLVKFVLTKAAGVNCVSEYIAGVAVNLGASPGKTTVIHSARDIPEQQTTNRKENIALFCGFLDPRKDPMTFLKAVNELISTRKVAGIKFAMVGDGSLKGEVKRFCREHALETYIDITGALPLEQVWKWMSRSKILVLPSVREPSGAVLTEAMAHRCYCIAARVGGIPELVTPARGSLFEPGDYHALADNIENFFKNEAAFQAKIDASYAYVREHYSFERAADELEASFRKIS